MKTAIVTGAGSGIGFALTRRLLDEGWAVVALMRRPAQEYLKSIPDTSERLSVEVVDLANAADRRATASRIAERERRIDAVFNVAGVSTPSLEISPQGREMHYEVNTIAPYVLTEAFSAGLAEANGRVVNVVSDAIFFDKRFDPQTLSRSSRRFRRVIGPYASSKLALALWSKGIAPTLAARGVGIVSITPGPNDTPLVHGPGMPMVMRLLARVVAKPPTHGANLLFDAATSTWPSGSFLMKGRVHSLPFEEEAERTLQIVAAAARNER